jgi:hypothetical protein
MPRVPVYGAATGDAGSAPADGFPEKLAKYVPAEALAFYVPIVALTAVKDQLSTLLAVTAVGVAGTILYLYNRAKKVNPPDRRPRWWFYVLAGVAFVAWAVGTVPEIVGLSGLPVVIKDLAVPVAVFIIPAIDEAITPS